MTLVPLPAAARCVGDLAKAGRPRPAPRLRTRPPLLPPQCSLSWLGHFATEPARQSRWRVSRHSGPLRYFHRGRIILPTTILAATERAVILSALRAVVPKVRPVVGSKKSLPAFGSSHLKFQISNLQCICLLRPGLFFSLLAFLRIATHEIIGYVDWSNAVRQGRPSTPRSLAPTHSGRGSFVVHRLCDLCVRSLCPLCFWPSEFAGLCSTLLFSKSSVLLHHDAKQRPFIFKQLQIAKLCNRLVFTSLRKTPGVYPPLCRNI
jgi:hypothetical protein